MTRRICVIGATGAQCLPVCRGLTKNGAYSLRVLTRDTKSERAKQLAGLDNDEFIEGSFANEEILRRGYAGCYGAFLAIGCGIRFFVFGNLDYAYKKGGCDPKFRAGHYDGKGRLGEWMLSQRKNHNMGTALFTAGPSIEMDISTQSAMVPHVVDGVVTWSVPLADGAMVLVTLDDCEYYVRWLFDNPEKSDGMDLEVTGKPAKYIDIPLSTDFEYMPAQGDIPVGYNADPKDPATMTVKQNFAGFWNLWRYSGGNNGVIRKDYELLDEIHPSRIRKTEKFFRREEEKRKALGLCGLSEAIQSGNLGIILKAREDGRKGALSYYMSYDL